MNVIQHYIEDIQSRTGSDSYLGKKYVHILEIRRWQLKRRLLKRVQTLSTLETLKTGHRQAEHLLLEIDIPGAKPQHVLQHITNILNLIALEFHAEIVQIEAQHPELRTEFAREKERYRVMWNDYLEATRTDD